MTSARTSSAWEYLDVKAAMDQLAGDEGGS